MRKNVIIAAAVFLALNALIIWSAAHSTNLVTNVIAGALLINLAVVFILLCRQTGDWVFRLPAFVMATGYIVFVAYTMWDFLNSAD